MLPVLESIPDQIPAALWLVLILGPIAWSLWRAVLRRKRLIERHRADGTIGPAGLFPGTALPKEYDVLARLGTKGEAPRTLDDRVLHTSAGVRLLVGAVALAIAGFLFIPGLAPEDLDAALRVLPVPPIVLKLLLVAVALDSLILIIFFEARYNRDLLTITRPFRRRREFRWRDLEQIQDDGAYYLLLRFSPGGKAAVFKHCRGIEEFKLFAQEQMRKAR